jgi:hypothetical protein
MTNWHRPLLENYAYWESLVFEEDSHICEHPRIFFNELSFFNWSGEDFFVWFDFYDLLD